MTDITPPPPGYLLTAGGRILCRQCTAKSKRTGNQCRAVALKASVSSKCAFHGGKSTGPKTPAGRDRKATAKTTHGRPLEEMTCRSARTGQSVDRKPLRHQVLIPIRVAESVARRRILGLHATVCPLWDKQCRTSLRMPPQTPRPMFDDVLSTDNPQRKETSLSACSEVQTQPLFL